MLITMAMPKMQMARHQQPPFLQLSLAPTPSPSALFVIASTIPPLPRCHRLAIFSGSPPPSPSLQFAEAYLIYLFFILLLLLVLGFKRKRKEKKGTAEMRSFVPSSLDAHAFVSWTLAHGHAHTPILRKQSLSPLQV
jgi:hypothetical protein